MLQLQYLHILSIEFSNLSRIREISRTFGVVTGYSDHTEEIITPSLAVVAGAKIIEKHVTLDKERMDQIIFFYTARND